MKTIKINYESLVDAIWVGTKAGLYHNKKQNILCLVSPDGKKEKIVLGGGLVDKILPKLAATSKGWYRADVPPMTTLGWEYISELE